MSTFTTLVCETCLVSFQVYTSYLKLRSTRFCSRQCWKNRQRLPSTTAVCERCGMSFTVKHAFVKWHTMRFCSSACEARARGDAHWAAFWGRVAKCGHGDDCPYCCWEWLGSRLRSGHGKLMRHKKNMMAYRVAWELLHEQPFPPDRQGSHWCHNPPCCNPMHITPATPAENYGTSVRDGAHIFGSRHGNSKLAEADIVAIFTWHAQGHTHIDIATRLSIDPSNVLLILHRKAWTHVKIDPALVVRRGRGKSLHPDSPIVQEVYALHLQGVPGRQIMKRLHLPKTSVYRYIRLAQEVREVPLIQADIALSKATPRPFAFSETKRRRIYRRDGGICHLCGEHVLPQDLSIDHIIPRSKGGTDDERNLATAHVECNRKRGNRDAILVQLRLF